MISKIDFGVEYRRWDIENRLQGVLIWACSENFHFKPICWWASRTRGDINVPELRTMARVLLIAVAVGAAAVQPSSDSSSVTVSGLSGGAFFASQFHVAFSAQVSGVGILAGGPYYCALGSLDIALGRCSE